MQNCFVASFGLMFCIFYLGWSTCHATKPFVTDWRNAVRWLVDLPCVDPRQVASLMKNELQNQNLLLKKLAPRSIFRNSCHQPATMFVVRQVGHARWKTRNINPKLALKHCCATSSALLYIVFRCLCRNQFSFTEDIFDLKLQTHMCSFGHSSLAL